MGVLHRSREIEDGEQHEYQCLYDGHEYTEEKNRQWGKESAGKQKENAKQGFFGHDVAEKPDGERKYPRHVAYDLNGKHQGDEPRDGPQKVFYIFDPMELEAKNMSGCENDQGAPQSNIDVGCR